MKRVSRKDRIRAMALLWKQYPEAHLGWCSSHFRKGYLLVGAVLSFDPSYDNPYIWIDKDFNVVKAGREVGGVIEAYP